MSILAVSMLTRPYTLTQTTQNTVKSSCKRGEPYVCQSPGSGRLARPRSPTAHHRRQASASRDIQARQHLSAHLAYPRCPGSVALAVAERHAARPVAQSDDRARCSPQRRACRTREQAGADRLGNFAQGNRFRPQLPGSGVNSSAAHQRAWPNEVCRKDRKDGLRVDRRLESPVLKMALDA
jgi:hypothetical protein